MAPQWFGPPTKDETVKSPALRVIGLGAGKGLGTDGLHPYRGMVEFTQAT